MLIHPACGARASGRAPASRLMQNFGAIFCVPAAAIVGTKLIALLVIGLQAAFSIYGLERASMPYAFQSLDGPLSCAIHVTYVAA